MLGVLSGCNGKNNPEQPEKEYSIEGCWELKSVTTKATVGTEQVSVYISMKSGSFELYQKIGSTAGHFKKYTGTYKYSNGILSGTYSDSSPLASTYTVTLGENSMELSTGGGHETDKYSRISEIPQSVIDDAF